MVLTLEELSCKHEAMEGGGVSLTYELRSRTVSFSLPQTQRAGDRLAQDGRELAHLILAHDDERLSGSHELQRAKDFLELPAFLRDLSIGELKCFLDIRRQFCRVNVEHVVLAAKIALCVNLESDALVGIFKDEPTSRDLALGLELILMGLKPQRVFTSGSHQNVMKTIYNEAKALPEDTMVPAELLLTVGAIMVHHRKVYANESMPLALHTFKGLELAPLSLVAKASIKGSPQAFLPLLRWIEAYEPSGDQAEALFHREINSKLSYGRASSPTGSRDGLSVRNQRYYSSVIPTVRSSRFGKPEPLETNADGWLIKAYAAYLGEAEALRVYALLADKPQESHGTAIQYLAYLQTVETEPMLFEWFDIVHSEKLP